MKLVINKKIDNDIFQIENIASEIVQMGSKYHLNENLINTFQLVFDELLSNVIQYAYSDNSKHQIAVRVYVDSYFTAIIEHDGKAFDPKNAPKPDLTSPVAERKIGGLGVYLVDNLINEVRYLNKSNKQLIILKHKIDTAYGN